MNGNEPNKVAAPSPTAGARFAPAASRDDVNLHELHELAEAELEGGVPNRETAARALAEAGGMRARARQIYWLLRAQQLKAAAGATLEPERFLREMRTAAERNRRAAVRRESLRGWLHACVCYASLVTAFIFGCAALPAYFRQSDAASRYAGLACVFAALGVVVLARSKRVRQADPFDQI